LAKKCPLSIEIAKPNKMEVVNMEYRSQRSSESVFSTERDIICAQYAQRACLFSEEVYVSFKKLDHSW
jgi:hypothetical protein